MNPAEGPRHLDVPLTTTMTALTRYPDAWPKEVRHIHEVRMEDTPPPAFLLTFMCFLSGGFGALAGVVVGWWLA